jgi:hypothetical protein
LSRGTLFTLVARTDWPVVCCQSHIATDGQSISKSWCRTPSGAHDQIFITLWQLRSSFCVAPSPTKERVCLLYMLLAVSRWKYSTPPPHGYLLLSQSQSQSQIQSRIATEGRSVSQSWCLWRTNGSVFCQSHCLQ